MVMRFDVKSGDRSERGFQRELLKNCIGWADSFHPSSGSKTGIPDVTFLYDGVLLPVELKIGKIVGEWLFISDVRPSQIRWAKEFRKAGGRSAFLCGVIEDGKWSSILLPFDQVVKLRQRFNMSDCECIKGYSHLFRIILSMQ